MYAMYSVVRPRPAARRVAILAVVLAAGALVACGLEVSGTLTAGPLPTSPGGPNDDGLLSPGDGGSLRDGDTVVDVHPDGSTFDGGLYLAWSRATAPETVDLTAEGALDWAHWGRDGVQPNRKKDVTSLISDYVVTGSPTVNTAINNPTAFAWSDGTIRLSESGATRHVYFGGGSETVGAPAVTLEVDAGAELRTAHLYLGLSQSKARLELDFTDGSQAPVGEEVESEGALGLRYTVDFRAPSEGAKLRLRWILLTAPASELNVVRLAAITVQPAG